MPPQGKIIDGVCQEQAVLQCKPAPYSVHSANLHESSRFSKPIIRAARPKTVFPYMPDCNTMQPIAPRLLYDRKEAARQLSISVRSLDYLIAAKTFSTRRIGKKVLIPHSELVRVLSRRSLRADRGDR